MGTNIANAILGRKRASADTSLSRALSNWRKKVGYYSAFATIPPMLAVIGDDARANVVNAATVPSTGQAGELFANPGLRRRTNAAFYSQQVDYRLPHQRGSFDIVNALTGTDDCPGAPIPAGNYTAASPYVDTGDTTGANDTVTSIQPYYSYASRGSDRIYTFVVTSIGADPEIKVTTTSPTYKPMIYVTDHPCPAGTGSTISDWSPGRRFYSTKHSDSRGSNPVLASMGGGGLFADWTALYFGKRLYLFIDSFAEGDAGPYTLTIQDMTISSTPKVERHGRPDFDGDGLSDFAVFRPGNSTWYVNGSTQAFSAVQWGLPTDKPVPEDYDGDGKTDAAVFRDGTWFIRGSLQGPIGVEWGLPGDIPVPADYTGDGVSEVAIYRDGAWWIYDIARTASYVVHWGLGGDKPVPMDYDADGKTDQAVYRDGIWYLNQSRLGTAGVRWGLPSDKPVPDYYGPHNHADFSVYRDGTWFLRLPTYYIGVPENGVITMPWGLPTDVPVIGNFFNVWSADAGVFRDGVWWMKTCVGNSNSGCESYGIQWGEAGDIPISAVYNR